MKHLNADVIFLQEAHLRDRDQARLKSPWINDISHLPFDSKARGAAILVNKRVHFTTTKIVADKKHLCSKF